VTTAASTREATTTGVDGDRILSWRWPRLYEAFFRLAPTSRRVRAQEIDSVLARIDTVSGPGQVVAEVGCGPGTYTRHLASRFSHVTAVDAAHGMLAHMSARMADEGHANVVGAYGSVPDDLRAVAGVDGLVAVAVLDFADDLAEWLRALRACVVPGGWMVFTVPSTRTTPRSAAAVEGFLTGRVITRGIDQVHEAAAAAGLGRTRVTCVEYGGHTYTLVGTAVAIGLGSDGPEESGT
jgi:trans-aconitate methyltransferase